MTGKYDNGYIDGVPIVEATIGDEMAAFDALPAPLRAAVRDAAFSRSCVSILHMVKTVDVSAEEIAAELRRVDARQVLELQGDWVCDVSGL